MKFKKWCIGPGTYTYLDPLGNPIKRTFTAKDVKHFHDQGKAMKVANLSIPVPLEHQPTAKPFLKREDAAAAKLKNNTGFVDDYVMDGEDLYTITDIKDPDVAAKISVGTIPFTSPWITSFIDGDGKQWSDVIGHVALTTQPRITKQKTFENFAAALSILGPLPANTHTPIPAGEGIAISRAGLMKTTKDGKVKPAFPMAFSLLMGIKLSEEEVETIEKEEAEEKPKERESPLNKPEKPEDKDVKIHDMIQHLLKALGFNPPDGMDESTFVRDVYETLMAKVQEEMAEKKNEEKPAPTEPEKKIENPIIQESPSMYGSLEEINAMVTDTKERESETKIFVAEQRAKKAEEKAAQINLSLINNAKPTRTTRVERILAKMRNQKEKDRLLAKVASTELSIGDNGQVVDPLEELLSTLENNLVDVPAILRTPAKDLKVESHPRDGEMTKERRKEVMQELDRNLGHRA